MSLTYRNQSIDLQINWLVSIGEGHCLLQGWLKYPLRENCPNTEFFWYIFSRKLIEQEDLLRNAGKYRPEKLRILTNIYAVIEKEWVKYYALWDTIITILPRTEFYINIHSLYTII